MANLSIHTRHIVTLHEQRVFHAQLEGIISASTMDIFWRLIEDTEKAATTAVFDFAGVTYINSTALAELAGLHHRQETSGLRFCLCCTQPDILFLMKTIGINQILNIYETEEEALAFAEGRLRPRQLATSTINSILATHPSRLDDTFLSREPVLIVVPEGDNLGLIIELTLRKYRACAQRAHNLEDAREFLARGLPGLVIIDAAHPEFHEICHEVKLSPHGGMSSIISIGPPPPESPQGLLVFPDRHLPEPYDLNELIALAKFENRNRFYSSLLYKREIRLELCSDASACERGRAICERLALASGMPRQAADSFFFAVREAIDNACMHGNRLDPKKAVEILYLAEIGRISVTIIDDGEGFDYENWLELARTHDPLAQAQKRREAGLRGGLGILLIKRCCDEVRFSPPGNILTLSKNFVPEDAG